MHEYAQTTSKMQQHSQSSTKVKNVVLSISTTTQEKDDFENLNMKFCVLRFCVHVVPSNVVWVALLTIRRSVCVLERMRVLSVYQD